MSQGKAVDANSDLEAKARVQFYADVIGVDPPARLVSDDDTLTRELLDFCKRYGASLDWIFFGDVRAMIHDSYRITKIERGE